MVGRNEACPCGSGKKYEKCCGLQTDTSYDMPDDEELEEIILTYFEQVIENPTHFNELQRYKREWIEKLGDRMPEDDIEQFVVEYFLFIARRDLWRRYLIKILNGPVRSPIRSVIEMWQNPFVLFAEVLQVRDGYLHIEEVLGENIYCLKLEEDMWEEENELVFGIVLPDNRDRSNGIRVLEGLMFIRNTDGAFADEVRRMAEESSATTSYDFFKTHMVDIFEQTLDLQAKNIEDFAEQNLTIQQKEVLEILQVELEMFELPAENGQFIQMIAITYLLKERPTFRKPEVVAAAIFKVAYDAGLLDQFHFTQSDIAEKFDVSTSSMKKHVDKLEEAVVELMDEMELLTGDEATVAYEIGTDPRMTERVNWEMSCKANMLSFDPVEEFQEFTNENINEPFKPVGKKQQAQAIAYEAYEAEKTEERFRLANRAYALDPKNVDALLLQAEKAETDAQMERFYKAAIQHGEAQFDEEPEIPWYLVTNRPYLRAIFAYGIWLYENERYVEAARQFKKLLTINPGDHQGARYMAASSCIFNGDLFDAQNILEDYEADEDAPYLYLKWLLEMELTEGESEEAVELFEAAEAENPYVSAIIDEELPRLPYPRHLSITPGSIDEAMFIYYLL